MDGTAISEARQFHPLIGPVLWTSYACLSSTLLLSTMISILSHSFRGIAEDSAAEVMFKKVKFLRLTTVHDASYASHTSHRRSIRLRGSKVMPFSYINHLSIFQLS